MKQLFAEATPKAGEEAAKETFQEIRDTLGKVGLTDPFVFRKLKSELNAKEIKVMKIKSLKKGPADKNGHFEIVEVEEVVYSKPLKAHDPILKAIELWAKIRGAFAPQQTQLSGLGGEPIKLIVEYDGDGNGSKGSPPETP